MTLLSLSTKSLALMAVMYSANGFEVTGNGDSKFDEMANQGRRDLVSMFSRDVAGASSKNIRAVRGHSTGNRALQGKGKGKKGTDAPIGECDTLFITLECEAMVEGVPVPCDMLSDDVCSATITYTVTLENIASAAPSISSAPSLEPSMTAAPTAKKGKGKKDGDGKGKKGKKDDTVCTSDGSIALDQYADLFISIPAPGVPNSACPPFESSMDLSGTVLAPGETEEITFEQTIDICTCPEWFFASAASAVEGATECTSDSGKGKGKSGGSDGTPCFVFRSDAESVALTPSASPSMEPTATPSAAPSAAPSASPAPSAVPSSAPSAEPSTSFTPTMKGKGKKGGKGKKSGGV